MDFKSCFNQELQKIYGVSTGFYQKSGSWNPVIKINGKFFRERSELLLLKRSEENSSLSILIQKRDPWDNNWYKIPGGGTDPKLTMVETAIKECEEEAKITPKDVRMCGVYDVFFGDKPYQAPFPKWLIENKEFPIVYCGYHTYVCVGFYDKPYEGHIDKADEDTFDKKAKWIPLDEAESFLREPHLKAIEKYFGQK